MGVHVTRSKNSVVVFSIDSTECRKELKFTQKKLNGFEEATYLGISPFWIVTTLSRTKQGVSGTSNSLQQPTNFDQEL